MKSRNVPRINSWPKSALDQPAFIHFRFLGLLEVPGETRHSRRTRDGRTPFYRQEQVAAWFGVAHPEISRWYDYWLRQDWRRILSQRKGEVLTLDPQQQIVDVWKPGSASSSAPSPLTLDAAPGTPVVWTLGMGR